jgi:hypothetical protein
MATEVPVVVDTGGAGDYPSLAAAVAAQFGVGGLDFVDADVTVICDAQATTGAQDTATATFINFVLDVTHRIKIWTNPATTGGDGQDGSFRHLGKKPTPGEKIYCLTGLLTVSSPFVDLEGIAQGRQLSSGSPYASNFREGGGTLTACFFYGVVPFVGSGTATSRFFNVGAPLSSEDVVCRNCIWHMDTMSGRYAVRAESSYQKVRFYHCLFINPLGTSIYGSGVISHLVVNCIEFSVNGSAGPANAFDAASGHNGYATSNHAAFDIDLGTDYAHIFVDFPAGDYQHAADSAALRSGTDVLVLVPEDILGVARLTVPDLGPFQLSEELAAEYALPYLGAARELERPVDRWAMPQLPYSNTRLPPPVGRWPIR